MIEQSPSMIRLLALCLLVLLPTSVWAQASSANDHPLLARFPDSEIISVEFEQDAIYRLVLSGLQRTRGLVAPEESQRLRGDVTKIVYEISQEFSGEDAYQFFREQMESKGYSELFSCSGRACGSSNYWANDIFRNRILYGPERNQYYLAMRTEAGAEDSPSIALYIITRGNRRIYAYLEIVEVGGAQTRLDLLDANKLLSDLHLNGVIVVSGISFVSDDVLNEDAGLLALADLLSSDPSLQVYLVAHLAGEESLAVLQERSLRRAQYLRQRLIAMGIDGERLNAQGVGPLAPSCAVTDCANRVELVLR